MQRFDLDDVANLRHTVEDEAGAPLSEGVTVAFEVTYPEATTPTDGVVSNPSTGVYDVAVAPLDERGRYRYVWRVSGAVTAVVRGAFYVDDDDDDLPPLASFDRFVRKIGYRPIGAEADRANSLLADASELIRGVAGKTWCDAGTGALEAVPRRIRSICIEAAFRAFGNPEALSQRTIGDSSKSFDRAGREGGEAVYLTDDEERAVRGEATGSGFASITLTSPYSGSELDPWAAVTAE